jgi:hypothetical protein
MKPNRIRVILYGGDNDFSSLDESFIFNSETTIDFLCNLIKLKQVIK